MEKIILSFKLSAYGEPCTKVRVVCYSVEENKKARVELESIRINKAYSFVTFVFTSCIFGCIEAYINANAVDTLEELGYSF
jgi:hypothetical protein